MFTARSLVVASLVVIVSACGDDAGSAGPDFIDSDGGADGSSAGNDAGASGDAVDPRDASDVDAASDAAGDDVAIDGVGDAQIDADLDDTASNDSGPTDAGPTDAGPTDVSPTDSGADLDAFDAAADVLTDTTGDVAGDTGSTTDVAPDVVEDTGPVEVFTPGSMSMSTLTSLPWLMNVTPDGVSVMWETTASAVGEVYWGYARDRLTGMQTESISRTTHEVRLEGLRPGTTVWYAVGQGGRAIAPISFRTAPTPSRDAAYSFVVWGDNQNGPGTFDDFTPMMAGLDPDFGFSTGDCVQNGTRREYREQLLVPIGPLASHVPFLVGAGNHERYSDPGAALFNEYMSQPGDEHCFGWRYGDLFLVFIDTELEFVAGSAQNTCIVNAFRSDAATTARFQGAVFHKPPRIEWWFGGLVAFTNDMEEPDVRGYLEPLFETLGVDIVFNGHNHLYAYTPETDGGITWVTTGGAGGQLDTPGLFNIWRVGTWPEIETTIHEFHFLHGEVSDGVMTITAVGVDGAPLHEFTIER